jgi:hypothetical protein
MLKKLKKVISEEEYEEITKEKTQNEIEEMYKERYEECLEKLVEAAKEVIEDYCEEREKYIKQSYILNPTKIEVKEGKNKKVLVNKLKTLKKEIFKV